MSVCDLTIAFSGYWHCGSGSGVSAAIDARVVRDELGLPFVPGRTLKGVLRDAVRQATALGHVGTGWEGTLFGSAVRQDIETGEFAAIEGTDPGVLQVGSGRLAIEVRDWLSGEPSNQAASLADTFFAVLSQTAVEPETSVAMDHSLRAIEVAVPLRLTARLGIRPSHADNAGHSVDQIEQSWIDVIERALPLVDGLGAHRTRGLGRCRITVNRVAS